MRNRLPAVAGAFYPADAARLRAAVAELTPPCPTPARALAIVVPHAGYAYSGAVAGEAFARVQVPDAVCILATNHTGRGPAFSVWPGGRWETPLGSASIDAGLTSAILAGCAGAQADETAQEGEHSAEVELPFILFRNPGARIAVVTVAYFRLSEADRLTRLREFGCALGIVLAARDPRPLVVASTDMTHCGPSYSQLPPRGQDADAFARAQDAAVIERIVALDPDGLYRVVHERNVTLCGWAPTMAALQAALEMGATRAVLARYATSAEVSGDRNHVVGYAGVLIS